ncbi:MAG: site-specific DNA-methyltransferase, partial [Bacteroidota bacterium]
MGKRLNLPAGKAGGKRGTETSSFGTTSRIGHDSSKFYNSKLYSELAPVQAVDENDNGFPPDLVNTIM